MKKLLLTLGTTAAMVGPLATTVACGSQSAGKYNTDNDGKIEIMVPWGLPEDSNTAGRRQTISSILNSYNDQEKNATNFMPVSSKNLGSYQDVTETLRPNFETQKKSDMPNLAITYPDTLGLISKYDMHLDLGKKDINKTDDSAYEDGYGVDRSKFEDFAKINDEIGGIPSGGYFSTSFGRSADLLYTNKPLLKEIITYMESKGASISGTEINAIKNADYSTTGGDDSVEIKSIWIENGDYSGTGKTFDDDIFTDIEKMLDFAIEARSAYSNTIGNGAKQFIIGIDAITNFMYQYGFALANGDMTDFYFNKNSSNQISWNFRKSGHKATETFKTVYEKLEAAVKAGAVTTNYDGANYSSNSVKGHNIAFGMGSSSGYTFNYDDGSNEPEKTLQINELGVQIAPTKFGSSSKAATLIQGASIVGIHANENENKATRKFVTWFYDESKKITKDHEGNDIATENQIAPIYALANAANYVYASDDFLGNASNGDSLNAGQKTIFDTLVRLKTDSNYVAFENPVNWLTDTVRTSISSAINGGIQNFLTSSTGEVRSLNEIYNILNSTIPEALN